MKQHIETITDLLLGAAYADKRLEGSEIETIKTLLCKMLHVTVVPDDLQNRMSTFNPAKLDLSAAGAELSSLSADDKRKVLDLVATVSESDDIIDFDEDAYLGKVAQALGLSQDEVRSMGLEILGEGDIEKLLEYAED